MHDPDRAGAPAEAGFPEAGFPYRIGDRAEHTRCLTAEDVAAFAALTGDDNPLHLDAEFARGTPFGRPVVHGLLTLSMIGALLGTRLPGPGAIYVEQQVRFRRPVYVGDRVTAAVEVIAVDPQRRRLTLRTECRNQEGETVLEGTAVLVVPGGA
ncbi:MAG TPA: MaoC family dehydratase [Bacillota bacterium]